MTDVGHPAAAPTAAAGEARLIRSAGAAHGAIVGKRAGLDGQASSIEDGAPHAGAAAPCAAQRGVAAAQSLCDAIGEREALQREVAADIDVEETEGRAAAGDIDALRHARHAIDGQRGVVEDLKGGGADVRRKRIEKIAGERDGVAVEFRGKLNDVVARAAVDAVDAGNDRVG
ncbi:MAG: hypothetical protein C0485_12615 [Pirellula sp.]|nr:hypothetical protein [Pirellula sp.]